MVLPKNQGSLGFSIIGGTDHSCVPFGTREPGIFISHVSVGRTKEGGERAKSGVKTFQIKAIVREEGATTCACKWAAQLARKCSRLHYSQLNKSFDVGEKLKTFDSWIAHSAIHILYIVFVCICLYRLFRAALPPSAANCAWAIAYWKWMKLMSRRPHIKMLCWNCWSLAMRLNWPYNTIHCLPVSR